MRTPWKDYGYSDPFGNVIRVEISTHYYGFACASQPKGEENYRVYLLLVCR